MTAFFGAYNLSLSRHYLVTNTSLTETKSDVIKRNYYIPEAKKNSLFGLFYILKGQFCIKYITPCIYGLL